MRAISAMISSSAAQDLLMKNSNTPTLLPALMSGSATPAIDADFASQFVPRPRLCRIEDIAR